MQLGIGLFLGMQSGVSGPAYEAEAVAYFAAFSTDPGAARKQIINTLIKSLKTGDVWPKLAWLYLHDAHEQTAALIDAVNPSHAPLVPYNSPTWAAKVGFTGDGAGMYLRSSRQFNSYPLWGLDSAHLGVWSLTAGPGSGLGLVGEYDAASARLNNNLSGSGAVGRINVTTNATLAVATGIGHTLAVRTSSTNVRMFKNGVGTNVSSTSSGIAARDISFLRINGQFSNQNIAITHAGAALSDAEAAALYNAFSTYRTAIGAL